MSVLTLPIGLDTLSPTRALERRDCARRPSDREVWLRFPSQRPGGLEFHWWARVCDVSPGGIGLVTHRAFPRGAVLAVRLEDVENGRVWSWTMRVVHASACPSGGWRIGCAFPSSLGEDELRCLLPEPGRSRRRTN